MCVSVSCEMNPKVIDACGEEIMVEGRRFHANSERNTKGLGRHLVRRTESRQHLFKGMILAGA
ncbi:hypothetical protein SORBI_3006G003350 [Sorghum bicolor]|uniref:Uncharacterized protein n=1 Tax=Sorghum bicolor TaxID=4558 RepID=A0A1Z5RBG4_SORBI|nr:hypothetical protein SORBI_3006G003350 [Sorghum bicolor]